ncbi:hypothetical protein Salat_1653700 [Sesamum alatum]|uniref:Uncharacterized protein n=1 Tax=Sesamum alatum TaxID=300844 RepID=A0AAE1Y6G8_9LAMI|nr:hypothetical protein Salat_1653700 [Sesamum alatum]
MNARIARLSNEHLGVAQHLWSLFVLLRLRTLWRKAATVLEVRLSVLLSVPLHPRRRSRSLNRLGMTRDPLRSVAAKDAAEEAENTKHFKEMVVWWKQAREELRLPNSRIAEMEGDKLDPGWTISARSSVLRSLVGQDSWELYKACLLERDQVLLAQTSHIRVEEHIAHVLTQAMAFSHDLSLYAPCSAIKEGSLSRKLLSFKKMFLRLNSKTKQQSMIRAPSRLRSLP